MDPLSQTFAALADPTRREILARLAEGEATVNELAEPFPISLQAVSWHLRVLEGAGLITRGRSAQRRPSRLQLVRLKELDVWIDRYRQLWGGGFEQLAARLRPPEGETTVTEQLLGLDPVSAPLTITRLFDAPRELLWREWTEPARFADWFGGPEVEVPLADVSIELRPGGAWGATTLAYGAQRRDIHWSGEYLEVVEPERLAFTIAGLFEDKPPDVVIVILGDDSGERRTEMRFRQYGRRAPADYELARRRWLEEFDRIAERMAGQP